MGNSIGQIFRITTAGESYGGYYNKKNGGLMTIIEGVPAGVKITKEGIERELEKRRTGVSFVTTGRRERDEVVIFAGVMKDNITTGAPLGILVANTDMSDDQVRRHMRYRDVIRPGHANYTYYKKYGEYMDYLGGGRASGRETVSRVVAGAVAKEVLDKQGIDVIAYTVESHGIKARDVTYEDAKKNYRKNIINCPDLEVAEEMIKDLAIVGANKDSCGGVVEVVVRGAVAGLGEPVFDKMDAMLAHALMSIGGIKGVEFGAGFRHADMLGSEANDIPFVDDGGKISFRTNNAGGILGGITTGEEIRIRVAVKPTPTISLMQGTVDMKKNEETKVEFSTRNDVSICARVYPVCEAMVRIVVLDAILQNRALQNLY